MNKVIEFFKDYGEELLVFTISVAVVISALILVYWAEPDTDNTNSDDSKITIHTVDKHEYLVYQYDRSGGICHKVDCKFCMNKNEKD